MTRDRVVGKERKRERKKSERLCVSEKENENAREKEGERTGQENGGKIIFKYSYQKKKMCRASNYWRPNGTREIRKSCETIAKERKRPNY